MKTQHSLLHILIIPITLTLIRIFQIFYLLNTINR